MRKGLAVIASAAVLLMTACGVEYKPTQSGVFVKLDKSLEGAYVEAFDGKEYDIDDLQKMGQKEVQQYNKQNAELDFYSSEQTKEKLPISLDSVKKQGNDVIVRMTYATAEDYTAFNAQEMSLTGGDTLYTEKLSDTIVALEGDFVTVNGEAAAIDEIMTHNDYQLVYVNYKANITVEGKIAYISTNVNCNTENNVNTPAQQKSYIIFKK